jgi:hypothetical protein
VLLVGSKIHWEFIVLRLTVTGISVHEDHRLHMIGDVNAFWIYGEKEFGTSINSLAELLIIVLEYIDVLPSHKSLAKR